MFARVLGAIDRGVSPLAGWLFVIAGIFILGVTLLLPAWLNLRELAWRRGLMQAQTERMTEQSVRYEQMLFALESEDRILLRRLAYHHFRLKPQHATVLADDQIILADHRGGEQRSIDGTSVSVLESRIDDEVGVEGWLHMRLPQVGVDYPQLPQYNTRLVRLTTGPARILLFVAAGLCLMIGLFLPTRSELAIEARDAEAENDPIADEVSQDAAAEGDAGEESKVKDEVIDEVLADDEDDEDYHDDEDVIVAEIDDDEDDATVVETDAPAR